MQTQSAIRTVNLRNHQVKQSQKKTKRRYTATASTLPDKEYVQTKTAPTQINISIVSDRIPLYKEYHQQFVNAIQLGNTVEAIKVRNELTEHLQKKITQFIPGAEGELSHTLGIWESGFEQSFRIAFSNLTDDILHAMVKVANHFDQDSVHFIRPVQLSEIIRPVGIADNKGNVFTSVWEFFLKDALDLLEFQKIIGQSGLGGAQLSENGKIITIYNSYNGEQSRNKETAKAATEDWEAKATTFARILQQKGIAKANIGFGEFRSYGRNLQSATRLYAELDNDISISKQYQQIITDLVPSTRFAA